MEVKDGKTIPRRRWPKYFSSFTHGNRGRLFKISRFEGEKEQTTLEEELPLLAVTYDPHHNGTLSISGGEDRIEYEHPINEPESVWIDEDEDGWTKSMIILDKEGTRTVVSFH